MLAYFIQKPHTFIKRVVDNTKLTILGVHGIWFVNEVLYSFRMYRFWKMQIFSIQSIKSGTLKKQKNTKETNLYNSSYVGIFTEQNRNTTIFD